MRGLGLIVLLALAGCGNREAARAPAPSAEQAAATEQANEDASAARMDASYREAGEIARAAAREDVADSNAREVNRVEAQGKAKP